MNGVKGIAKLVTTYIIVGAVIAVLFLRSDNLAVNIIGMVCVGITEIIGIIHTISFINYGLPINAYRREYSVMRFCDEYGIKISYKEASLIADASFYSEFWAEELIDMCKGYNHPSEWYASEQKKDKIWLRIYMMVFPVKELSADALEQYEIVNKHFDNLAREIMKHRFVSNDEAIRYINNHYYLSFDKTTYSLWKSLMKSKYRFELLNEGQIGVDTELAQMIRKYDNKRVSSTI